MNFLQSILDHKREEVSLSMKHAPLDSLRGSPFYARKTQSLVGAIGGKRMAVIAEVKKASPSKNIIRHEFDPVTLALDYARGGASALSVLTDRKFFQGDIEHLRQIREIVSVPLLRKDFIIHEYQLHESKAAGADAVLLIVAALGRDRLNALRLAAGDLGLETLIEVHTKEEVEILKDMPVGLVGINNRDLATFQTDLETTFRLQPSVVPGIVIVSESGIGTPSDLQKLIRHGIHAALIGESLMRAVSPGVALRELLDQIGTDQWSK